MAHPAFVVITYGVLFFLLYLIGRRQCNGYVRGMALMAFSIFISYLWVWVFDPGAEDRSFILRYLFLLLGGMGIVLALSKLGER